MIITIDGPAGAGKSTLAIDLAKRLHFFCLNSGYIYRGMAYVLEKFYHYTHDTLIDVNITDVQACIDSGQFCYEYEQGIVKIFFSDMDITLQLKDADIAQAAAIIAQNAQVRKVIRAYKHQLVDNKDALVEGRVTGSVVFPGADLKLYVTASEQVRSQRFVIDQAKRGKKYTQQEARALIIDRDEKDMNRMYDALVAPQDAVILDTSNLSIEEALQKTLNLVHDVLRKK